MRPLLSGWSAVPSAMHGVRVNYAASYWTPPMTPKLAFELESRQIEKLGLAPMVSITDHDNIKAPMLLRTVPSARQIPVSVEWSAPYGGVQAFHLGVHNLPSARAPEWMATLEEFTANPSDARLTEILRALHDEPNVLVVFNHPLWDLYLIGQEKHEFLVNEFLQKNGAYLHALELNGLRNWDENRAVRRLAEKWNMLLISGGDRHGVEPNANINLTNAASFTEFVHEIRREAQEQRALHAAVCRALEASPPAVHHRRDAQLSRVPAGLAQLGRARLSSRRQRRGPSAERVVAQGIGAHLDARHHRTGSAARAGAGRRRPAHGLERVAADAPGPRRKRRLD